MRTLLIVATLLVTLPAALQAQESEAELRESVRQALAEDATLELRLDGVEAAIHLREFDEARAIMSRLGPSLNNAVNSLLSARLLHELSSGGGIDGIQRRFREARGVMRMHPLDIAPWLGSYPELLVGGEFDEMIRSLSPEAADPRYRCECYGQKAWMYRVSGDMDRSRMYWDSLAALPSEIPLEEASPAFRAQRVRNLARAGRAAEARGVMELALSLDRIADLPPSAQRNWAQAYAELGEVEQAVEILERLLAIPSQVTVHSLEARVSWDVLRGHPAFQDLLARHR
jgi:tetratricopeptide (TPR) repeat protein